MIRHFGRFLILAATAMTLVACTTSSASDDPQPGMTFAHVKPVRLMVNDVQIINGFTAPLRDPHIEHELTAPPARALTEWAQAKFLPARSGDHHMRMTIRDASMKKQEIETDSGITGFFTDEQKFRYTGSVDILIEIYRGSALSRLAWIEARASREITVPESTSLRDRDDALFAMTEDLVREINVKAGEAANLHFAPFIVK